MACDKRARWFKVHEGKKKSETAVSHFAAASDPCDDYDAVTAAAVVAGRHVWQEEDDRPRPTLNTPPPAAPVRSRLECLYLEFSFPLLWLSDH